MTADKRKIEGLAFIALLVGNLALACGPFLVRNSGVGPVAAGFWRLALALPLLTVVAGVVTYRIAAQDTTDSDPDAVRRIAQMQTVDLARDENALRLALAS